MRFDTSNRSAAMESRVSAFFEREVLPRHRDWVEQVMRQGRPADFLPALRDKARAEGLWNLALPALGE